MRSIYVNIVGRLKKLQAMMTIIFIVKWFPIWYVKHVEKKHQRATSRERRDTLKDSKYELSCMWSGAYGRVQSDRTICYLSYGHVLKLWAYIEDSRRRRNERSENRDSGNQAGRVHTGQAFEGWSHRDRLFGKSRGSTYPFGYFQY